MRDNTVLIYAVTLIGIALLSYILWNLDYSEKPEEEPVAVNDLFCGTHLLYPSPSNPIEEEGKSLFKINCAACHKINKQMVGPSLLETIKKYPTDSSFIMYLKKEKEVGEYGGSCMQFPHLKENDATALRAYINIFLE